MLASLPSSEADSAARATAVVTKFLKDSATKEGDVAISQVTMASRRAAAVTERTLKRAVEGAPDENLEAPLGDEQRNSFRKWPWGPQGPLPLVSLQSNTNNVPT